MAANSRRGPGPSAEVGDEPVGEGGQFLGVVGVPRSLSGGWRAGSRGLGEIHQLTTPHGSRPAPRISPSDLCLTAAAPREP